jgi:hypothetical protein
MKPPIMLFSVSPCYVFLGPLNVVVEEVDILESMR